MLASGIQGRVDIEIQGQRLNNTMDERAGVKYGNDHRLCWNVAAPMPKIVVSGWGCGAFFLSISHTHTHMHTHTHTRAHTHTHTHTQACLSSVPTSLCSGEVCRVGVEVFNCGRVPLNSLRITTSLKQRILLDQVL